MLGQAKKNAGRRRGCEEATVDAGVCSQSAYAVRPGPPQNPTMIAITADIAIIAPTSARAIPKVQ